MSMTHTEKIFSELVLGATLPKPTEVRLLNVKYRAVMYLDRIGGPPELLPANGYCCFIWPANSSSQPMRCGSLGR